jgi:signal transduction histidine kinase
MASELASVEDREKRKIAEYLHDNLGQSLALARIKTGKLLRKMKDQDTTISLNDIENDIADAINYTQSVIYELSPPILYELGLLEALKWKMDNFEKKHGLKTRFIAPPKITELNEDINLLIFRSITELLNDVIKHANAGSVELDITQDPDGLTIALADDGTGFDYYPDKIDPSKELKFGIFSIKERINHYGGAIDISSDKGKGSIVTIFVPLNQSS